MLVGVEILDYNNYAFYSKLIFANKEKLMTEKTVNRITKPYPVHFI